MILQLGQLVINPTARFIAPIMNTFTSTFLQNFNLIRGHLLGFAIGDLLYDKAKKRVHKYLLFTAFSVNGIYDTKKKRFLNYKAGRALFANFLTFLKKTRYYYDDYIYDDNIHVIVFALPEEYNITYEKFLQGKYSQMYKDNQIKLLFQDKGNIAILKRLPEYKEVFKEKVKRQFSVEFGSYKSHVKDEDVIVDDKTELELPPTKYSDWL